MGNGNFRATGNMARQKSPNYLSQYLTRLWLNSAVLRKHTEKCITASVRSVEVHLHRVFGISCLFLLCFDASTLVFIHLTVSSTIRGRCHFSRLAAFVLHSTEISFLGSYNFRVAAGYFWFSIFYGIH